MRNSQQCKRDWERTKEEQYRGGPFVHEKEPEKLEHSNERLELRIKQNWVQILGLPLTSYVTLGLDTWI